MIIDFHTHAFPEELAGRAIAKLSALSHIPPCSDGTYRALSASAREAGIDLSVVLPVATSAKQVATINATAARVNEHTQQTGLFSFGGIHPDAPDWREVLARVAAPGLKGIKLHPVYQGVNLDDPRYLRILERAGELGLIVVTHTGLDIGYPGEVRCTPEMVLHALREVGPVTLVLAHMGGWRQWDQARELLTGTSVYLDTAFSLSAFTPLDDGYYAPEELHLLDQEGFLRIAEAFGTDRLLFGTDSPWSAQRRDIDWIRALPLSQAQKDAIFGENARRLLALA